MKNENYDSLLPLTGIGSVPYLNISEAIEYSLEYHIPFLPQLVNLGEDMIEQAKSGVYLSHNLFLKKILQENISDYKLQISGPCTTGLSAHFILKQILSLVEDCKIQPFIFIDEPLFDPKNKELTILIEKLRQFHFKIGIHSCAKNHLEELLSLDIDMVSIDAQFLYLIAKTNKLKRFFKNKKKLVLGVIPTNNPYQVEQLKNNYQNFIVENVENIWLSPACGLAHFTIEEARIILNDLKTLRQSFIDQVLIRCMAPIN